MFVNSFTTIKSIIFGINLPILITRLFCLQRTISFFGGSKKTYATEASFQTKVK